MKRSSCGGEDHMLFKGSSEGKDVFDVDFGLFEDCVTSEILCAISAECHASVIWMQFGHTPGCSTLRNAVIATSADWSIHSVKI